jgi:hypothetical protein
MADTRRDDDLLPEDEGLVSADADEMDVQEASFDDDDDDFIDEDDEEED